jgi:hypothetical protein
VSTRRERSRLCGFHNGKSSINDKWKWDDGESRIGKVIAMHSEIEGLFARNRENLALFICAASDGAKARYICADGLLSDRHEETFSGIS